MIRATEGPVKMPKNVAKDIETIRQSGRCNMLDRNCVQVEADIREMYDTVVWLEDHKKDYGRAIMCGITFEGAE